MVHVDRERQFVERLENSLWRLDLPIQGGKLSPVLRHHGGRQVHSNGLRRQEGVRVRGHLLENDKYAAGDERHRNSSWDNLCLNYFRVLSVTRNF